MVISKEQHYMRSRNKNDLQFPSNGIAGRRFKGTDDSYEAQLATEAQCATDLD